MISSENNNHFNIEKKRNKYIKIVLFLLVFLIPVGFGVSKLFSCSNESTTSYKVKLASNYGEGLTISENTVYADSSFSADIKINRSIITDKVLPDSLNASDVTCKKKPISFTYTVNSDKFSANIKIPSSEIKGDIKINVTLVTPTATFQVTLKANGGRFTDNISEITLDAHSGDTLNDLVGYSRPTNYREGYHFTHWELESDRSQILDEDDPIPYNPSGVSYVANCDLNLYHVSFKGNGGTFNGNDTLDLDYSYDDVINEHVSYITPIYPGHTFLYYEATDVSNENQKFYETDRITTDKAHEASFGLKAVYADNLEITFSALGGHFSGGGDSKIINAYDGITIKEIEKKQGVDLTPISDVAGTSFVYYKNGGNTIYWNTPLHGNLGKLSLDSVFSPCTHPKPYVNFAVDDDHVYGICPDCFAPIPLTDEELETASAKKAILVPDETDPTLFRESDQQEVKQLIHDAAAGKTLHLYLIGKNFELNGSRDGGIVNVHLHGVLNSKNEKISSFKCYATRQDGTKTYASYGGMHLVTENLIMNGSLECGTFYLGIQSDYLTCNNCDFKGIQSFYSPGEVICNNCTFDSTMLEKKEGTKSEYCIYSYAPYNIEFNQCDFISRGKALKLYTEGYVKNAVYKLTDCHFTVINKLEDKAAIQVDSTYVKNYDIYITRCTQEGHTAGLYQDTANPSHAHFIVSEE